MCGEKRSRQDRFLDLGLQLKTPFGEKLKGVKESLDTLFEKETLDGDNKLTCDSAKCQGTKTASTKGAQIAHLPPVMILDLFRFELDYETW